MLVIHNHEEFVSALAEVEELDPDKPLAVDSPEYRRAEQLAAAIAVYEFMHPRDRDMQQASADSYERVAKKRFKPIQDFADAMDEPSSDEERGELL